MKNRHVVCISNGDIPVATIGPFADRATAVEYAKTYLWWMDRTDNSTPYSWYTEQLVDPYEGAKDWGRRLEPSPNNDDGPGVRGLIEPVRSRFNSARFLTYDEVAKLVNGEGTVYSFGW
jgi:hypothetical protein